MLFRYLFLLLFLSFSANAQDDILVKELLQNFVEDLPADLDLSELTEHLIFLKKHPLNLNRVQPEELKTLFFLSGLQIANFFSYRLTHGKLIDVLEIQAIDSFDAATVQALLLFITINENELREKITTTNLAKLGENDLVLRFARTLEKQKGFRDLPGTRYLGTVEKLLLRYKYNFSNRITASLVMEKDAGEKLSHTLPDFLSANLTLNDIGKVAKLVIGDYSLQFGQGLTLWSGFGFGKGPDVTSLAKKDLGLRSYASANEYSFLRGIAAKIRLTKHIDITSFLSSRKHDASLSGDELTTINETGYHRTATEIVNSNSIVQNLYGTAIDFHANSLNIGSVIYRSHYNKSFTSGDQAYRQFYFTGSYLTNVGFNYNYTYKNSYLFGEIAHSIGSGAALVSGLMTSLSNHVSAVMMYRSYQKDYHNFFNQAPAESEGMNENGFYIGLNIAPTKKWMISLYADYFKFPWLKFRVDAPSQGREMLAQVNFTPSKIFKTTLRYKSELKQQNTDLNVPINYLEQVKRETFRLDVNWRLNKSFALQNKFEVALYKKGGGKVEQGYLVYQDVSIAPISSKFSGNVRIAYFHTPTYNSRIYAYEDDILYNFSFGVYSGKGFRNYVNIKYKLFRNFDLWARYALFYYKDVQKIGTGLDEINGSKKSELKFQLRLQF